MSAVSKDVEEIKKSELHISLENVISAHVGQFLKEEGYEYITVLEGFVVSDSESKDVVKVLITISPAKIVDRV